MGHINHYGTKTIQPQKQAQKRRYFLELSEKARLLLELLIIQDAKQR